MRKRVKFIEKTPIGVKMYRVGQTAVIQGGLADALEAQGKLLIVESVKAEVAAKEQKEAEKAEKPAKKTKD